MKRSILRWSLILVATLIAPACAIGSDTPNKPDPRLQQKITYAAKHKPIKLILADLSKMTGVTLRAGASEQDWQVRDRRMNIFVKDLPLLTFMNSMARVMDFTWDKNIRVDPPTYRVYMDRKKLAAAEAKRSQADAAFRQYEMGRRAVLLDFIKNPPDYSAEEWEEVKAESPYLYLMHKRGNDKLFKALLDEVPGYEDAFMTWSRILNPPASILSDSTLEMVISGMKAYAPLEGMSVPAELDIQGLKRGLVRLTVPWEDTVRIDTRWCFGGIGAIVDGREYYIQQLQDPDEPYGNIVSKVDTAIAEGAKSVDDIVGDNWQEWERLKRLDSRKREESEGCEPLVEHPDEPWLHTKIKLDLDKKEPCALRNVLDALAKASGYNVISDSFNLTYVVGSVSAAQQETGTVMNVIADNYGYNWNKHNSILEFRDRNWLKRRRTQIPDEWMERWKANFKEKGEAVLEDLAQMATLSFEQLDENVDTDPVFQRSKGFVWTIRNGRGTLRVYNSFTPSQRKALMKDGVLLGSLSPEQRDLADSAFDRMDTFQWNPPRFWEDPEENIVFKAYSGRLTTGETTFNVRAVGKRGDVYFEQEIILRQYVPEPKDEAEKKGSSTGGTK
jgi:hypothetical protein